MPVDLKVAIAQAHPRENTWGERRSIGSRIGRDVRVA